MHNKQAALPLYLSLEMQTDIGEWEGERERVSKRERSWFTMQVLILKYFSGFMSVSIRMKHKLLMIFTRKYVYRKQGK